MYKQVVLRDARYLAVLPNPMRRINAPLRFSPSPKTKMRRTPRALLPPSVCLGPDTFADNPHYTARPSQSGGMSALAIRPRRYDTSMIPTPGAKGVCPNPAVLPGLDELGSFRIYPSSSSLPSASLRLSPTSLQSFDVCRLGDQTTPLGWSLGWSNASDRAIEFFRSCAPCAIYASDSLVSLPWPIPRSQHGPPSPRCLQHVRDPESADRTDSLFLDLPFIPAEILPTRRGQHFLRDVNRFILLQLYRELRVSIVCCG